MQKAVASKDKEIAELQTKVGCGGAVVPALQASMSMA